MKLNAGVGGKFRIVAIRPDGTERVLADWFDNLILDKGLDRIATFIDCTSYCRVGSGSTPPDFGDLQMEEPIASTTSTVGAALGGNSASAPYYGWSRKTFRFALGAAAGSINEVGIGWGTASGQLFSRALVKNSIGDPITLTVLSDEVLDVTYELRVYPPVDDVISTVTIAGIEHTVTGRASAVTSGDWRPGGQFGSGINSQMTAYSNVIGTQTQYPSGSTSLGAYAQDAYVQGSYELSGITTFGLTIANFGAGGIRSLLLRTNTVGCFQFQFDPPILKDANKIVTINSTMSWSRYTP